MVRYRKGKEVDMFGFSAVEEVMTYIGVGGGAFVYSDVFHKYLDCTPAGRVILFLLILEVFTTMVLLSRETEV